MDKQAAIARAEKLRALISDYRYNYHVLDKSTMSEAAADSLKHELVLLEQQYPELITPDSPSQRVAGKPLAKFASKKHITRMISLNDVFNLDEVNSWEERILKLVQADKLDYFIDLKMDGFACSLTYTDGVLEAALTRGDGLVGEDITQNVKTIGSIPLKLREKKGAEHFLSGRTEVRGEILMYQKDFNELNAKRQKAGEALFKNPRNTAAGTIRQLDTKMVAERKLYFHGYDLLRDELDDTPTYEKSYKIMAGLGFKINKQAKRINSLDEGMKFAEEWELKRLELDYGTDGLVIKVNDRAIYEQLGVVGKAPRGAIAYKYPAEEATTKIKDIIISVGRTGAATPVAVMEPVQVAGSTVKHASLHNQDEIQRLDVRIGDTVIIHKAGDIIPKVTRVLTELRDGSEKVYDMVAELREHELDFEQPEGEVIWRAKSDRNPMIVKKAIQHFASKQALDIEGLGEKNVDLLVDNKLVNDFADLYTLRYEDLKKLDRFADLSSSNLVEAIEQKQHPALARFVNGLGIRHVGIQTSVDIANKYLSLDKLMDTAHNEPEELYEIEGIGEVVSRSIAEWFSNDRNIELLKKFKQSGVWPDEVKLTVGKLQGQTFAITGSLESMGRELAAEKIRLLGGTFQSSVGKGTNYLVHGAKLGDGKRAKAEQFGTKLLGETEFLKLIE